jgi:hypothetical protein
LIPPPPICHPERREGSAVRFRKPILRQVGPCGVRLLDQCDFFLAPPAFDLFLSSNRVLHVGKRLDIYEPMNLVSASKSRDYAELVLRCTLNQIACHAYIEVQRSTGHDVDGINLFHLRRPNNKSEPELQIPPCVARPPLRDGKCKSARDSARNDRLPYGCAKSWLVAAM